MAFLMALLIGLLPLMAQAQSYPDYSSTTVNDYAGLLPEEVEARIDAQLTALRKDTGIEMTVVTLTRQATYAPGIPMEAFATGLFNHWGIGDKALNNGILVLVLPGDRAMRIELGAGYAFDWNRTAEEIVDDVFLPSFRKDDYANGIELGTTAVVDRIAYPFHGGAPAPKVTEKSDGSWIVQLAMAAMALPFAIALFGRSIMDKLARLRTCPKCGQRGLTITRKVKRAATTAQSGDGIKTTRCLHCDYVEALPYTIARRSSRSSSSGSGGFGGGRSGGGGASGRW